jgi:hypothetical protein
VEDGGFAEVLLGRSTGSALFQAREDAILRISAR